MGGLLMPQLPDGATYAGRAPESSQGSLIPDGAKEVTQERKVNGILEFANKVAQGATFGFGDEISAAMVGSIVAMTGGSFRDGYDSSLGYIRDNMEAYELQNPKMALAGEIVGGITTGGLAGGRVLAAQSLKNAPLAARVGAQAGVGAVEGGVYGAGAAEEERFIPALQGALIGAIAAPVGTKVVDWLIQGGKVGASFIGRKLADTPRKQAMRAVRNVARSEGIDEDQALQMFEELGPEATLADLGENFRALARAGTDAAGEMKTRAKNIVYSRQLGQQERLLVAAEVATGQTAGNFNAARAELLQSRQDAARPLYQAAWELGMETTDKIAELLARPAMAKAMRDGANKASNEGEWTGELGLARSLHYAKRALDDQISKARFKKPDEARVLIKLKNELLTEMDLQNKSYEQARALYSSDSSMIDAMDMGMDLFKTSVDDIDDALRGMTQGEKELFNLGAVRAVRDTLDNTNQTADATRKLLGTKANQDRLARIMTDPETFIRRAMAETEFTRTRNTIAGGSPTSQNLAGQSSLQGGIQPELIRGLMRGDAMSAAAGLIEFFGKNEVTPEVIKELADIMLRQGKPPADVLELFTAPAFVEQLGATYQSVVLPAISGAIAPVMSAATN
jgi:hypothetical protein